MDKTKITDLRLTPWGKEIEQRLSALGKDWTWICNTFQRRGYNFTMAELTTLATVDTKSKTRRHAVEKLLYEEERRQKYRKMMGFKGEGLCHTRSERNNSKNS